MPIFGWQKVLEITLADISISEALQRLQVTNVANARAREIFADCINKTGLELKECLSDPVKIAQAEQILQSLSERENPLNGNLLQSIVDASGSIADLAGQAVTTIVTSAFVAPVQTILIALQWTFVNGVEIALFLTAMFAPIALGLSMIPSAGPSIIAWVTGFIGLFLTQLGYVIVVGVAASIISLTEEQGQAIGTIIPDIAFLLFLSIAAPIIAGLIAKAGGTALFNGISRSATTAVRLIAGAASGGTGLAASSAIASSRKANLTKPLSAKL